MVSRLFLMVSSMNVLLALVNSRGTDNGTESTLDTDDLTKDSRGNDE